MGPYSQHFIFFTPDTLDCYITLAKKGLPGTNTLAFWCHSLFMNKIKCCVFGSLLYPQIEDQAKMACQRQTFQWPVL
jgi:hypothetical protein